MKTEVRIPETANEFFAFIDEQSIKFTEPQQLILNNLRNGWRIVVRDRHRMNGGTWVWAQPNSDYDTHAGHIYRAFWNIKYKIRKTTGVDIEIGHIFID